MRIRSIKPEWLEDELIGAASDEARVLSIALILMADDYGRGRASAAAIAAGAWRFDLERDDGAHARETLARASRALRELVATGFARVYEVHRQSYYEIRNWTKHQKVDRPSKPRIPEPENEENAGNVDSSRDARETLASVSRGPRETLDADQGPKDQRIKGEDQEREGSLREGPKSQRDASGLFELTSTPAKPKPKRSPSARSANLEAAEAEAAALADGIPASLLARVQQGLAEASGSGKLSAIGWRNAMRDVRAAAERHGANAHRAVLDSLEVYASRYAGSRGAQYLVGIVRGWEAQTGSSGAHRPGNGPRGFLPPSPDSEFRPGGTPVEELDAIYAAAEPGPRRLSHA